MQFDIRRFDIYRKVPKDLTQPTKTGAVISILSCVIIVFLVFSEFQAYLYPTIQTELFVGDPKKESQMIPVKLSITLPHMACKFVGLDIMDDLGRHDVGFIDDTVMTPLNQEEGCYMQTSFRIAKVSGNFHVSTHSASSQPTHYNMQHTVDYLTIGDTVPAMYNSRASFHSMAQVEHNEEDPLDTHDYFLKIVPSAVEWSSGEVKHPYQYTFAHRSYGSMHGRRSTPAIWFRYEILPITVKYTEVRKPFYHFLTMFCAIIGGTFTVTGILDSLIFTAHEAFKKAEIGKLS